MCVGQLRLTVCMFDIAMCANAVRRVFQFSIFHAFFSRVHLNLPTFAGIFLHAPKWCVHIKRRKKPTSN